MKKERKKYLVTNFSKLNYKSGSNLVFLTEYLFHLYKKTDLKKYRCTFANKISFSEKISYRKKNHYLEKKLETYRKELSVQLNNFHGTNYSTKYWGVIIDYWLIVIINNLQIEIQLLKNTKKNFKNLWTYDFFYNKSFFDSLASHSNAHLNEDYQKLVRTLIAKTIGIQVIKEGNAKFAEKYISTESSTKSIFSASTAVRTFFSNFTSSLLRHFFKLYIFLFKPVVILDGFFGKKNSIKIFFKSFCRIIFLPSSIFFYKKKYFFTINTQIRSKIKVKQKDFFDKIFNLLVGNLFPTPYLEGFDTIRRENLFFTKRISKIGTGIVSHAADKFLLLAAEVLNNKGKFLSFQHGGCIEEQEFSPQRIFEKKHSTKRYLWTNSKGLGQNFLTRYKKISISNIKNNKLILIFPTNVIFQDYTITYSSVIKRNYHPYLNQNYAFFKNLNKENKNNSMVKLFPNYKTVGQASNDSDKAKKIWKKNFGDNVNFGATYSSKVHFYKSRLIVINDISTPLYELIYVGIPFIIIADSKFNEFKKKFAKNLNQLEKLNILHRSPIKAAKFVNKNYDKLAEWWQIVSKEKSFINFKKNLFVEKKDYTTLITKELVQI